MIRSRLQAAVVILAAFFFVQCGTEKPHELNADAVLADACTYLWEKQGEDGGWHSEVHGLFKTGQALTPFILFTLMDVPENSYRRSEEKIQRGLGFLRKHVNENGVIGLADPDVIEYPVYSTAYALRVLVRYGTEQDSVLIGRMRKYLIREQFAEPRGINPGHPAYGSWGFGETNLAKGTVGHVDLSHTRRALEALREAGYHDAAMIKKATRFLRLLQKHPSHPSSPRNAYDGGFYFSPVVLDQNKAGRKGDVFRSYATPTCGGLLALLAAGHGLDDEPVKAAVGWLEANPILGYPQGIPEEDPDQWRKVLFFYHLSVRAEAYHAIRKGGAWKEEMVRLIAERQKKDGSFANPYGLPNKEDDPLLATALVIGALTNVNGVEN